MPPTEQVFWEARYKPESVRSSRRSSTVVDAAGCKITMGFLLPSRSARGSSSDTQIPRTPASPMVEAAPGFSRPTGSLYHAPEMAVLRSNSESSLHRPSAVGALHRPTPLWAGRSQTFNGRRASWWRGGDGGGGVLVTSPLARDANPSDRRAERETSKRRTQSDYTELRGPVDADQSCAIISSVEEEETAIASDSDCDSDDVSATRNDLERRSGIAAQRSRPTYAQRRAMSDQRNLHLQLQKHHLTPRPSRERRDSRLAISTTTLEYISTHREGPEETPIEIRAFADREMAPHHILSSSKSRVTAMKGVLKNTTGSWTSPSPSSSGESERHVSAKIRKGSGSSVVVDVNDGKPVVRDERSSSRA